MDLQNPRLIEKHRAQTGLRQPDDRIFRMLGIPQPDLILRLAQRDKLILAVGYKVIRQLQQLHVFFSTIHSPLLSWRS